MDTLIIFDVDGTLTDTTFVDNLHFAHSVREAFSITEIDMDWNHYKTVTDHGVVEELFIHTFGRPPGREDLEKQKNIFLDCLRKSYREHPHYFREINGAKRFFEMVREQETMHIGIATGGWAESAKFKLDAAGFSIQDIPLASSSDTKMREDIVRLCIERSKQYYGFETFDAIVSFGDGLWDMKIARQLQLRFIGIGDTKKFEGHGITAYTDFLHCLEWLDLQRNNGSRTEVNP